MLGTEQRLDKFFKHGVSLPQILGHINNPGITPKIIAIVIDIYQLFLYNTFMKRIILTVFLLFTGMAVFSQNMSFLTEEYMRTDSTFAERLATLEVVRDSGATGIGEFYHNALKFLILRAPDIRTNTERAAAERSAVILCEGLAAEKYTAAAGDIWQVVELFDIVRGANDGSSMRAALIALGQINAVNFVPQIVQRLNDFNTQPATEPEFRRRAQLTIIGCINALEALKDIRGYRPIFFVYVGPYDPPVKEMAFNALPNIVDDPADVLIEIIQEPSSDPRTKLTAWNELLRTRAPNPSKAKVAAAALETGWSYATNNRNFQTNLRELRKGAIDAIRQFGVSDDSVYTNLEFSYSRNFINSSPDFDEIMLTLNALAAVKTEQSIELLHKFLMELHGRRRSGPWANKERRVFEWVVSCIGTTGTQSNDIRNLLDLIGRTASYTSQERNMATNALTALGGPVR